MLSTHNRITKSRNTKRVPYNWCSGYLYLVFHLWKPLITWPLAFLEHVEHMEHRVFTTYDLASLAPIHGVNLQRERTRRIAPDPPIYCV